MLLQESFENQMPLLKLQQVPVLRMMDDAATCILLAFFDTPYRVTASYTEKYHRQTGPDTVYNCGYYNWVSFVLNKNLDQSTKLR